MKKKYLRNIKPGLTGRLWALLALLWFAPLLGQAQSVTVTPSTVSTNPDTYGSVAIGVFSSPAKQYAVVGEGLSGNISVSFANAPSFEGSIDNITFSKTPILPSTGGNLYIRFRPTAIGTVNERIRVSGADADFNDYGKNIFVQGTGIAGTPTITINPTSLSFGSQQINGTSAPMSVTVNATSLKDPIIVTAPTGFLVSYNGSSYATTVPVPQDGNGAVTNAVVNVVFTPTAAQNYVGNVTFASTDAATRNTGVSGVGILPPASLSSTPASLSFPTLQAGQISEPQNFTVTGSNLTSVVTVTAPAGFEIRLGASGAYFQSLTLNPNNNQLNANLQARFKPNAAGSYTGNITATTTGNGGASTAVAVSGTGTPVPTGPFIVVSPNTLDFQTVSGSGSAQTLAFSINAANLKAPLVLTASNGNIVFRDASAGGSFVNGPLIIAPSQDGTVSLREIEVRLIAQVASGVFSGTITASSEDAANQVVTVAASSIGGNSTINVDGVLEQFTTVPGVASAVQSYVVTGTNLLEGLRVAAPASFQVSLSPTFAGVTGTGNSFVIPQMPNGDVPRTTVYVRFLPSSALSITSVILNSSSPAISQAVSVNGTSEPSIQIANPFVEVTKIVLNTKSASQALNIKADRVLQPITISSLQIANPLNVNNTPQFELSLDNVTFSSFVVLTPNTSTYKVDQPLYVRYAPTYLGTGQATLQYQSNDFADKSTRSIGTNDLLSGKSIDVEPTLRSNAVVTRSGATATVTFNLPANYAALGYGEGRLIVASEVAILPGNIRPEDGTPYTTGNQTYGAGPQLAPGFFVVYSGSNNSVIIDGLNPAVTYYFYTFEFNNIQNNLNTAVPGAENYLSPPVPNEIPGIIAPGEPPLPVTLVSFSAKTSGSQVAIRWETASELNNKQFEVERSRDSRTFETIITRAGRGTTNATTVYNEVDRKPLNGLSYYRLKQVDLDGKTSYSTIVPVSFLKAGEAIMYPNPVTDQLTITLDGGTDGVAATITDLSGRTVRTQQLRADGKLDMANLQAGTYLVTVGSGKAKVTRRIVKQ